MREGEEEERKGTVFKNVSGMDSSAGFLSVRRIFRGKCICKIQKRAGAHVSKGRKHAEGTGRDDPEGG